MLILKRTFILLTLFLVFISPIIAQIDKQKVDSQVWKFQIEQHYDEAIDYLNNLIASNPNEVFLYKLRAGVYFSNRRVVDSIADITKAIQIEPTNADLYYLRSTYHQANKDEDSFFEDLESAISIRPEDPLLRFKAAKTMHEAGDFKRSLKTLEGLNAPLEAFPLSTNIYKLRFKNNLALEQFEDALDEAYKAIEAIPVSSIDWRVRHAATIQFGNIYDFKDILPILSMKLEKNEARFDNYLRFIELFEEKAKGVLANPEPGKDEAESSKNQGFVKTSAYNLLYFSNSFMISCAQKLVQAGEIERAEALLDRLVQKEPVWYHRSIRATYFKEISKYDQAIEDLTVAINNTEGGPKWESQRMLMTPAGTPKSMTWKMALLFRRGDLFYLTEKYQNAIDDFRLAIETDPQWKEKILEKIAAAEEKLKGSEEPRR